ncbi:MAM and LDL-receptor class A domain-containing protein 2-like [Saccostrea echinata]|uniref:MAM and LDL-receptor class A domain-containing protein 2-like n=1 Tax=Saccostrea echinata TaxID=191078 RepID=UPI002A809981|nr:MAM and LDL-receptor class A domain-containing protein 2-like [Saccostrea echinata]
MAFRVETVILCFLCALFSFVKANNCHHSLSFYGYVPKAFDMHVFKTITTFPYSMMVTCSNKCVDNPECRAMDVCDSDDDKYCRLVRSLNLTFTSPDDGQTCKRYKVDRRCADDEYFDRIRGHCQMKSTDLCDFETSLESSCFLTEATDDIFNWTRHSGNTPSSLTGPEGAKAGTYYMYIEATYQNTGENAKMVSNRVFEDKTHCLSMYYHMYGSRTGTLKIQTKTGNDTAVTHWEMLGNQGNQWNSIDKLNLPLNNNTKIIIEGVRGHGYESDISVDYIMLRPFSCV